MDLKHMGMWDGMCKVPIWVNIRWNSEVWGSGIVRLVSPLQCSCECCHWSRAKWWYVRWSMCTLIDTNSIMWNHLKDMDFNKALTLFTSPAVASRTTVSSTLASCTGGPGSCCRGQWFHQTSFPSPSFPSSLNSTIVIVCSCYLVYICR